MIANNWADLTDGAIAQAIDRTETGAIRASQENVWTNTLIGGTPGGLAADGDCENWSDATAIPGNTGRSSIATASWTNFSNHLCNSGPGPIYCFQQR